MSRRGFALVGAGLLLSACSSAAVLPAEQECRSDDDCPSGFVCATDQGACLPGNEAAPRAHLGFDIRERIAGVTRFRVEIDGCDCLVGEAENIRELSLRRSRVSQQLELSVASTADPAVSIAAEFVLSQPSRLGLAPAPTRRVVQPADLALNEDDTVLTRQRWPRYHPLDGSLPPELIVWEIDPEGEQALRYHGLKPPRTSVGQQHECNVDSDCCEPAGSCDPWPNYCDREAGQCSAIGSPQWTFADGYEPGCDREIDGRVSLFDPNAPLGEPFAGLPAATVQVRYADAEDERFGIPVFGSTPAAERPPQCDDDSDCDTANEYCDPDTAQCFMALRGRLAADAATSSDVAEELGEFRTRVYTYCDDAPNAQEERSYDVTVSPTGPRPTVNYTVPVVFFPPQQSPETTISDDFCVPDWGPAQSLAVTVSGPPRQLAGLDGQAYTCCDVACLPPTIDDVETTPSPDPAACDGGLSSGRASLRLSTDFIMTASDLTEWATYECVMPALEDNGRAGRLERAANCSESEEGMCTVDDLALGSAEQTRRYRARFESPVGSVLASEDFAIDLDEQPPEAMLLSPRPRVLVTGVVDVDATICARREPGEDCSARSAIVMAERLRLDEEPDDIPGPFFHHVPTFFDPVEGRDGAFVLPLDPGGVYVLTALPGVGAEGGPANFTLVDLRAQAPSPLASQRLVLQDGVLVTLQLEQFDQRTTLEPVDRGSYLVEGGRLEHPSRVGSADPFVDLNRLDECWTAPDEGPAACKIRRLIPPGSDLASSLVGQVRFSARRSSQAECTQTCPTPLPEP